LADGRETGGGAGDQGHNGGDLEDSRIPEHDELPEKNHGIDSPGTTGNRDCPGTNPSPGYARAASTLILAATSEYPARSMADYIVKRDPGPVKGNSRLQPRIWEILELPGSLPGSCRWCRLFRGEWFPGFSERRGLSPLSAPPA